MCRINNLYDHLDLFFPAEKSETHDSTAAFILDQTDLFKVRTVLNELRNRKKRTKEEAKMRYP